MIVATRKDNRYAQTGDCSALDRAIRMPEAMPDMFHDRLVVPLRSNGIRAASA